MLAKFSIQPARVWNTSLMNWVIEAGALNRNWRTDRLGTASQIRKMAISSKPSATMAPRDGECSTSKAWLVELFFSSLRGAGLN